jgi:hypothetical protein
MRGGDHLDSVVAPVRRTNKLPPIRTYMSDGTMNTGLAPPRSSGSWTAAIVAAMFHALAWLAFLLMLVVFVPRLEAISRDFDMKLPALTTWLLGFSHFLCSVGPATLVALPMLLAVDVLVLRWLDRPGGWRVAREVWSGLAMVLSAFGLAIGSLALTLPYIKLMEQLRR